MELAGYDITIADGGNIAALCDFVSLFFALYSTFYSRALYVISQRLIKLVYRRPGSVSIITLSLYLAKAIFY